MGHKVKDANVRHGRISPLGGVAPRGAVLAKTVLLYPRQRQNHPKRSAFAFFDKYRNKNFLFNLFHNSESQEMRDVPL